MSENNGNSKSNSTVRAVGYCRTSGEGQRDNTSIPRQKEAIAESCRKNGWDLVRVYVDECRSGARVEGRDEFKRMLRDAGQGAFDLVVPFDATRLARDGTDIMSTAKMLKSVYGIFVVDAKGQLDTRDHRHALQNFVHAGVSEHERLTIMERMLYGRVDKARCGLPWAGNPPVGRVFTPDGKKAGTWSLSATGRNLALLLERYAGGEPLSGLYRQYGFYSEGHVLNIIRGGQLAARPYVVTFHSPEVGIDRLRVEVPAVPPVISPDLERRVKDRLAFNRKWNRLTTRYPLRGFLFCGACGHALQGNTSKGNVYYRHHQKTGTGGKACGWSCVRGSLVEGPVLDYLYKWFVDQPAFDLAVRLALPDAGAREGKEQEARRAEADVREAERSISRLVDAIAAGADPGLLVGKQRELKERLGALQERLAALQGELRDMPDPEAIREEAMALQCDLAQEHTGKDWRGESHEDLQRFLHFLFGDDPKREGLGVFVHRQGDKLAAVIRARLRLRGPTWLQEGSDGYLRMVGGQEGEVRETSPYHEVVDLPPVTTSPTAPTPTSTPTRTA
jgi:site-specific DNA recombinase